jgi:hypothetical protein
VNYPLKEKTLKLFYANVVQFCVYCAVTLDPQSENIFWNSQIMLMHIAQYLEFNRRVINYMILQYVILNIT